MEKIYEMAKRHKEELINAYIKYFIPYKWKEGERELVLYDNALNDPLFKIVEIGMTEGVYVAKMYDVSEWGTPDFLMERDLANFDYEQLETIAEFFSRMA